MNFLKWLTPAVLKNAIKAGDALLRKVDFSVLFGILGQLVLLERELSTAGSGSQKLARLVEFVKTTWPSSRAWLDEVEEFAGAAVALFNAIGWFRK